MHIIIYNRNREFLGKIFPIIQTHLHFLSNKMIFIDCFNDINFYLFNQKHSLNNLLEFFDLDVNILKDYFGCFILYSVVTH